MPPDRQAQVTLSWAQAQRTMAHLEGANHRLSARMMSKPHDQENREVWSAEISRNLAVIHALKSAFVET